MDPKSSLFGLIGLAQQVRELVEALAVRGDVNLVQEGVTLLDDWREAQTCSPGYVLRTNIGGRLADFRARALRVLG